MNKHQSLLKAEIWIGHVLRWGVIVAATFLMIGLILSFYNLQVQVEQDLQQVFAEKILNKHPGSFSLQNWQDPHVIITFGLFLLIALPVARVSLVCALFIYQKDKIFVFFSCIVLAVLIFGIFYGKSL